MLPPDAVRTLTIYCRWHQSEKLVKPMRRVLHNCSWEERSISTALQTGSILRESVAIRVFDATSGLQWIPPHEWSELPEDELGGFWTCDLTLSAKPLIVPFEIGAEMGFATSGDVATWEENLMREVAGAARVVECNDNRKRMGAHIRLRA